MPGYSRNPGSLPWRQQPKAKPQIPFLANLLWGGCYILKFPLQANTAKPSFFLWQWGPCWISEIYIKVREIKQSYEREKQPDCFKIVSFASLEFLDLISPHKRPFLSSLAPHVDWGPRCGLPGKCRLEKRASFSSVYRLFTKWQIPGFVFCLL